MRKKELTGTVFIGKDGTSYVVTFGYENGELAFEEVENKEANLNFCCDAKIINGKLYGSYYVNYTVSKNEFFEAICNLKRDEQMSSDAIALALRNKYYKIPMVFLRLLGEIYLKGCRF